MKTRQKKDSSLKRIVRSLTKLGIVSYAIVLGAVCISNFSLFDPNWPFGLFASFSLYLILIAPVVCLLCAYFWRKFLIILLPLGIVAFYPFYGFKKYDVATKEQCQTIECLAFVSINLHHDIQALELMSKSVVAAETDLFLLMDLPYDLTAADLQAFYPAHPHVRIYDRTRDGKSLGSAMAVISKERVAEIELIEDNLESDVFNLRGVVRFSYSGEFEKPVDVFMIHPMMPLAPNGMAYRDKLIDRVVTEIGNSQNFILVGDFNLTPWEPKFQTLPGDRAGDPRWISTWDARRPWLRLPIDHVMLGRDIQTVESEVMPSIQSDHYPVHTMVGRSRKAD